MAVKEANDLHHEVSIGSEKKSANHELFPILISKRGYPYEGVRMTSSVQFLGKMKPEEAIL